VGGALGGVLLTIALMGVWRATRPKLAIAGAGGTGRQGEIGSREDGGARLLELYSLN
jgi:hypothetical protein